MSSPNSLATSLFRSFSLAPAVFPGTSSTAISSAIAAAAELIEASMPLLVDDSVVPKLDIGDILENLPIGISIGIRYRVPTP